MDRLWMDKLCTYISHRSIISANSNFVSKLKKHQKTSDHCAIMKKVRVQNWKLWGLIQKDISVRFRSLKHNGKIIKHLGTYYETKKISPLEVIKFWVQGDRELGDW